MTTGATPPAVMGIHLLKEQIWKIVYFYDACLERNSVLEETKAHDKKLCEATERLSGILSRYKIIYNDVWECVHQNLQVQKTSYMRNVLNAVVSRILELKHELQKLEASEYHFGSNGLIDHKLTPCNAQLAEIPDINERPENIQSLIQDIFEQVKERKRRLEGEAAMKELPEAEMIAWWDAENSENEEDVSETNEKKDEISEEQKQLNKMIVRIQSQERTRRVIAEMIQQRNKRKKWEKELSGTLRPSAPYEIREKAAKLIQQVARAFCQIKRQKILDFKRNELLDMALCIKRIPKQQLKLNETKEIRKQIKRKYEEKWLTEYESLKQECLNKESEAIKEDFRDYIRYWFQMWYESIIFFQDIPPQKYGGAALIFREELPTPKEWLEEYNAYLVERKANKGKSILDKKFAKMEAKREEMEQKKAEHMKEKLQEALRRKMMKNPNLHPGYDYPVSAKTSHILEVIDDYHKDWAVLDSNETFDVKEKSVRLVDLNNVYTEVKMELVSTVEDHMRKELKLLKKALQTDYENKGQKMPEQLKQKYKKEKIKHKVKKTLSFNLEDKIEDLVFHGYMTDYPKTKIEEFFGDPNFAGDDLRSNYTTATPHNGEIRSLWWDKCRELSHGFHKILLVGPRGSGKTTLVYVLATMNDAVLFELDPRRIHDTIDSVAYLEQLVQWVASCARAVQPAVIHIKHVHRLFYRKVPAEDAVIDWKLMKRFLIQKLFKRIQKTDKITIIGSCVEPWVTRSNQLLKPFPTVVLLPNTSHGTVANILTDWALSHTVIPADFNVSCLAHVLKGFSFGYLKNILEKFMSAETVIRIAARGLSPMDVYNFIIEDGSEQKVDYEKYKKWYANKTTWGKKEQKHQTEQLAFKQALTKYEQTMAKKKKKQ